MKAQFPLEKHDSIINAQLTSGAISFSASDWMASPDFEPNQGNIVSIFVIGETYDELKTVFDKLAEGAVKEKIVLLSCKICHLESLDNYEINTVFPGSFMGIRMRNTQKH